MSDESKEPAGQAAESTQSDEEEGWRLREVSEEELKQILAAHGLWLASDGKDYERADLTEINLQGANLEGAYLMDANLQGAYLMDANLQGANLGAANLEGAYLMDANLRQAILWGANLWEANLGGANLQGANLGRANLQKATLFGANLQGAILPRANLGEANFQGANLRGANLSGADLQGADLSGAELQGADLRGANLTGAILRKAVFEGEIERETSGEESGNQKPEMKFLAADLTDADLRNADLRDAKLSRVFGLLPGKLAGANLSNAKVPEGIAKFEGLKRIEEISKTARNIFLGVIGGCVFSWLTVATTTDAALLTNSATTPLPIIQTKVPIAGFYWAAPLILLSLYIYLHLYLQRLWEGMASLPAIFTDGRTLDERAYPWLLSGLVRAHVPLLTKKRPQFSRLQVRLSVVAGWVLVPATLALLWLRYLPRHEWLGTIEQIVLLVLAAVFGVAFYRRSRATLRGHEWIDLSWKTMFKRATTYAYGVLVFCMLAVGLVISDGAINGVPPDKPLFHLITVRFEAIEIPLVHRSLVPKAYRLAGSSAFLDLVEAEISIKPSNWTGLATDNLESQIAQVKKARLPEMDLQYANALRAFLVKADLRGANLNGANLSGANLQEANLFRANLQRASLTRTNLQSANLWEANLQKANLFRANLKGADLRVAMLRGADLSESELQGADLRGAEGVTMEQLDKACVDMNTKLPKYLKDYQIKQCPKKKKNATFRAPDFQ